MEIPTYQLTYEGCCENVKTAINLQVTGTYLPTLLVDTDLP